MRPCAFLEAWVQLVGRREPGRAQGKFEEVRIPQTDVTELIKHHKVAAATSQPWRSGQLKWLTSREEAAASIWRGCTGSASASLTQPSGNSRYAQRHPAADRR